MNLDFKLKLAIIFLATILISTLPWKNSIEKFGTSNCGSFNNTTQKCIPHKLTNGESRWVLPPRSAIAASPGVEEVIAKDGVGIKTTLTYKLCTTSNIQGDCLNNGYEKIRIKGVRIYSTLPNFSIKFHSPGTDSSIGINWEAVENVTVIDSVIETESIGTNVLVGNPSNRPYTDIPFNPAIITDMIKLEYSDTTITKPNQFNLSTAKTKIELDFYDELATSQ